MAEDLGRIARDGGIRYFLISFVDLFGVVRSKLVPASAIGEMQKTGAGFAGFATHLDFSPAHPDLFAVPDPASLTVLPWKPEVAWVAGDLQMEGQDVAHAPRTVLKRAVARAAKAGYRMMSGVECEYMVILPDGSAIADAHDQQPKPCYDQQALMRRFAMIAEICDAMETLGWGPYQNDHEDANGQFEMNWTFADALTTADRHVFFKTMVKTVAEKHGLRATFMPKPFARLTGNGCHAHVSLWDPGGERNLFLDEGGELGLAELAYHFLGGILEHAKGLAAIAAPVVNSYKRINAPPTLSGATWSPNTISYSGNNRTHMVRIPDPGRFEIRLADGAVNPYLLQASLLVAGLDGIERRRDPGRRLDIDMYTPEGNAADVPRLPLNLLDALRAFEADEVLMAGLGEEFARAYLKLRHADWAAYAAHLTEWERHHTLDV